MYRFCGVSLKYDPSHKNGYVGYCSGSWTRSRPDSDRLALSDPFADATKGDDRLPAGTEDYIHIRIQQRNGRKTLTTVQGISADYDKKKLVKAFKKVTCGSTSGAA